jgi:hypothetical protein
MIDLLHTELNRKKQLKELINSQKGIMQKSNSKVYNSQVFEKQTSEEKLHKVM